MRERGKRPVCRVRHLYPGTASCEKRFCFGELILLAADASAHRELGRFQALDSKTWNHPVVRGDRVYLRNAEEMACYSISPKPKNSYAAD